MDSEHQASLGDLDDNDLAATTQAVVDRVRPHLGTILLVAALLFAALAAWTLVRAQRTSERTAAWDSFINAFAMGDPGGLSDVADRFSGTPAAHWAGIVQGDAALADGNRLILVNPTQARQRLEAAVERYTAVNAQRPAALAAQRGIFGLARARESLGDFDEAIRGYEALVAEYPESAFGPIAEERIAALSRESTRQWYNWVESRSVSGAEPQPSASPESSDTSSQPAEPVAEPVAQPDAQPDAQSAPPAG